MDGNHVTEIISGLSYPAGIAVEFDSRRLFWAEYEGNRIQSSNLDGTDVQLVVQLSGNTSPLGIAVHGDRLFWGNVYSKSLQSSEITGQDVRTLYNSTHGIQHLTAAIQDPSQTRPNHCEGQECSSGICVLTRNSYRSVSWTKNTIIAMKGFKTGINEQFQIIRTHFPTKVEFLMRVRSLHQPCHMQGWSLH